MHSQILLFLKVMVKKHLKKIPQSYHPILATESNFTISACEVGLIWKEKYSLLTLNIKIDSLHEHRENKYIFIIYDFEMDTLFSDYLAENFTLYMHRK